MKIVWEVEDIRAGMRVGKPDSNERWIVGYAAGTKAEEQRWVLVSLNDGIVTDLYYPQGMAELLTRGGYFPGEWL